MSPELTELAERLNKLETQNRKYKRFFAVVLLLVGAVLLMGQARPASRTIEAEEFILKDGKGDMRGRLYVLGNDPILYLKSGDGKNEVWLEGSSDPGLLLGEEGNRSYFRRSRLLIGNMSLDHERLWLDNPDDSLHPTLMLGKDFTSGEPFLWLNDRNGFSARLGSANLTVSRTGETRKRSAASLVLLGKDGKVLWSAP